jgi:ABC-type sugar transport system substrate-binding protein
MPDDHEWTPLRDDEGSASSLLDEGMTRSELLGRSARLGLGALAATSLSGLIELGGPALAGAATRATKLKKIAVIEQQFGTFFTENFNKPLDAFMKTTAASGWSDTFGNENNTVTTGINLLNQYAAANYGVLILSTGDQMSAWEHAVGQVVKAGHIFINHCTQAVTGATQNVLFSHKQSGIDVGNASIVWAKKNNISSPVVALIGNLSDAQGRKRTDAAWDTIKAKYPNAKLAGQVQGIGTPDGGKAAANLLSAHPDINMLITFNTLAGLAALTSAQHAGKTDRNKFLLATTDTEVATLKLIADNNSIYQINWGAFFPASMILMAKDAMANFAGKKIKPTRLLFGLAIDDPPKAKSFNTIAFNPLDPKYSYVYTKYFKYLDTPVKTAQVPAGQ